MFESRRSGGIGRFVTSESSLTETEFQIWVNSRNRPTRGPWLSSSTDGSPSMASNIAATSASPEDWLPVRARAYRRNNGKCSGTSCERDIPTPYHLRADLDVQA